MPGRKVTKGRSRDREYRTLGEALRAKIDENGHTTRQAADVIGTSSSTVSKWMNDAVEPGWPYQPLQDYLGIDDFNRFAGLVLRAAEQRGQARIDRLDQS